MASPPTSLGSSFRRAVRSSYPTTPVSFFSVKNPPLTYFARPDLPELRLLRILDYNRSYRLEPFQPYSTRLTVKGRWLEQERHGFPQHIVVRRARATKPVSRHLTALPGIGELYHPRSLLFY